MTKPKYKFICDPPLEKTKSPFQYSRREISAARPQNVGHPQDARYSRGLIRYPSINAYNRKTPSLRECRPHRHIIAKPQVKRLEYTPDRSSLYSTSTRPEYKNEKLNRRIQNRNRDTNNVVCKERVVAAKKQQEGENKIEKVENKSKDDNKTDQGQNKQKEDKSPDKIVNKRDDSNNDKVVNEQKGEDNTVVTTENVQEDNKEDDSKTDEECVEKSANSSVVSMDLVSDDDEIIQFEKPDENPPKESEITKIVPNHVESILKIPNPKKTSDAPTEHTKKNENEEDKASNTKSGSDNSTGISISTATLSNNIASITETLTNIHELEKQKSPKTIELEAKSRDPRLQKKCREEPIGTSKNEQNECSGSGPPSDPRNIRKVRGYVRLSPLELKLPDFWIQRCRQKLKAKSSGTELVKIRKGSIKKKSHVCFKSSSELNEYGKIPIKQFSKYCCHVNIRRNECKYAPFQTISDEHFQSMIDTKKSYLIEKAPAPQSPNNDENKKELEMDSSPKKPHVIGSRKKPTVSDKDEIEKKKSGTSIKSKSICRHRHHRITPVKGTHSHNKLHTAGSTKKKLQSTEASKGVRVPSSVRVVSSSSIFNRSSSQKIKTDKTLKKSEKSAPSKRKREESPKVTKRIRTRADIDESFEYKTPPVLKFIEPLINRKETEVPSVDFLKTKHGIISGAGTTERSLSEQLEQITNPDKDRDHSAHLNSKSTASTPCRDENEDYMEYSSHIPEGGTHNVTSSGMEMSSEELIRALEQSIDGISSRVSSSEDNRESEEKNPKLDETLSDSSSATIPIGDQVESAAEVNESDSTNTTGSDSSPNSASISHDFEEECEQGDEEKMEDDEGGDIQIQVRVIENPEVKKEAEEPSPSIIDLFGVQAEVKREDATSKNDVIEPEPESITSIQKELEADKRKDSNGDEEAGQTSRSYTFTVPVGTTDGAHIRLPPKKYVGHRGGFQSTATEPVGYEDTPTINIECVYTRDTDSTETVQNQNDSFPEVRLSISVVTETVPGDISTSTSDSSSEDLLSTTNRQGTAAQNDTLEGTTTENLRSHNNVPVENEQNATMTSPIPNCVNSGTIAGGQEEVSNSSSSVPTPVETPRPIPRMSNISDATSSSEGVQFSPTKKYFNIACKIFKILNSYISTISKSGYVTGTLEYLQPTYNIATDKKNIDTMTSNMRCMFGSMLSSCMLNLPPNIQRIDVFLSCVMALLFRAIQNEKLMPYPTKYMWELVSVHLQEYERNTTLKSFKTYVENDVRRHQQVMAGFSMTLQQHYVSKAQIYQYSHLRKTISQVGVVGTNRQTVIKTVPQGQSSKPNNMLNHPIGATRDMSKGVYFTVALSQTTLSPPKYSDCSPVNNCQACAIGGRNLQCCVAANSIGSANFRSNTQQAAKNAKSNTSHVPQYVQTRNNDFSTSKLRQISNAPVNTTPLPSPNVNSSRTNRIYSPITSGTSNLLRPDQQPSNNDSARLPTYLEHTNNDTSGNAVTKQHHMHYPGVNSTAMTPMNLPAHLEGLTSPGNAVNTRQNAPSTNVNSPRVVWSQNQGLTTWNNNLGNCLRTPQTSYCPNIDISKMNLSVLEQATSHNISNTRQTPLVNTMNPVNLTTSPPTDNALNNTQTTVSNTRMSPMNLPTRSTADTIMNPMNFPASATTDNILGKNFQSSNVNHYVGELSNTQSPTGSNTPRSNVESNGAVEGYQRLFENISAPSAQKHKMDTPVNPTDLDVPTQKKRICPAAPALAGCNSESLYPTPPLSNASSQRAISPPMSESSSLNARKNCDGDVSNETTSVPNLPDNGDLPTEAQSAVTDEGQPDVKPFRSMLETMNFEHSVHSKDEAMEIIDLTWLDDDAIKEEPFAEDSCGDADGDLMQSESLLILHNRECLCGKVAEYLCSCNTVMYCSEACQLEDWANHQKLCPSTSSEKNSV